MAGINATNYFSIHTLHLPVLKKQIILENLLIEDYAAEGKCLAKVDGKVVFVENTVPGDVVDVYIYKSKKDWAAGWPTQFRKYAEQRVIPFCSHFNTCGGCQWQMLPYDQQLSYKQKQVMDNLQRIGKLELPEIFPIIGCIDSRGYRNKIEYTFSSKKYLSDADFSELKPKGTAAIDAAQNKPVAGFHAKGVFDKVVEIDTCYLQKEPTNQLRNAIADYARNNHLSFYDMKLHTGFLRNMQIRMATTGELMVHIIFGYEDVPNRKKLLDFVLESFPRITTLLYSVNTKFNESLYDITPVIYNGMGYIMEKLEDFTFKISPRSFFQTNTKQAEKLYAVARDFAELNGTQNVYDLYCGTGSIGIFCSRQAAKIIGVEVIEDAVNDAKENAALNHVHHAQFFCGDVIKICNDDLFAKHGTPDVIMTDPPRAGMHEKLVHKLLEIAAPVIVYISCNPATQARDLAILNAKYSVEKIQPVDMFPQTHHIENVVQLKLKKE